MGMILGIVIGISATVILAYMVVSIVYAISRLTENAASQYRRPVREIISDRMYSFAAFIVTVLMALSLLVIVCDRLTPL